MEDGIYILDADVKNPKKDLRRKGWEDQAVFPKGTYIVKHVVGPYEFWIDLAQSKLGIGFGSTSDPEKWAAIQPYLRLKPLNEYSTDDIIAFYPNVNLQDVLYEVVATMHLSIPDLREAFARLATKG